MLLAHGGVEIGQGLNTKMIQVHPVCKNKYFLFHSIDFVSVKIYSNRILYRKNYNTTTGIAMSAKSYSIFSQFFFFCRQKKSYGMF